MPRKASVLATRATPPMDENRRFRESHWSGGRPEARDRSLIDAQAARVRAAAGSGVGSVAPSPVATLAVSPNGSSVSALASSSNWTQIAILGGEADSQSTIPVS